MRTASGLQAGSRLFTIIVWVALLGAVLTEIAAFRTAPIFRQTIWLPQGLSRLLWYGLIVAAFGAISLVRRRYFIPLAFAAVLIGTIVAVGPAASGSVLLFVFSATVLGRLLFGRELDGSLAFLAGTAFWIAVMTLVARIPIHYPATYLITLALPLAVGYPLTWRLARQWVQLFRPSWTPTLTEFGSVVLVAFVAGAHWLVTLKPEVGSDGLVMHLAIPSDIAIHHAFTIDFRQLIWGLMPMGADWCYSVVYMLGGEYAARLLNLVLLAIIGMLLLDVAKRWLSTAAALVMLFLFLSTPLVQLVTGSLFVENFVAAMSLGAAVALWRFYEQGTARILLLTALLLGTSVALKLGAFALAVFLLPFLGVAIWKQRAHLTRSVPIIAVALLLATAALPYANAYWRSGNPLFPFANAYFRSPYYENENFKDLRFLEPLTWRTPLRLTFKTSRYYEGQDGSFGFQYLLLLPLTLVCFGSIRSIAGRSAAIVGVGSAFIIAATSPNARYFYPALPFLTLGASATLAVLATEKTRILQATLAACLAAGCLNLYLLPASSWFHKDFFPASLFTASGRQKYIEENAPLREAVNYLNRVDRKHPVVFTGDDAFGELIAPGYAMNWHGYAFRKRVQEMDGPVELEKMFSQLGIQRVLIEPGAAQDKSIGTVLAKCGHREFSLSGYEVVGIATGCEGKLDGTDSEPLPRGKYDETDPRLTFLGSWTQTRNWPLAYQTTVTFTQRTGARVKFRLVGRGFRYGYTKAFNRGMAEVLVDGSRKAVVDLYSPTAVWQSQLTITDLAPGIHQVIIRALPEHNASATGQFIDIDSVEILDGAVEQASPTSRLKSK